MHARNVNLDQAAYRRPQQRASRSKLAEHRHVGQLVLLTPPSRDKPTRILFKPALESYGNKLGRPEPGELDDVGKSRLVGQDVIGKGVREDEPHGLGLTSKMIEDR